jgi:hypothetical protein
MYRAVTAVALLTVILLGDGVTTDESATVEVIPDEAAPIEQLEAPALEESMEEAP